MERQRGMKFMDRHGWEGGGGLHITIWLYQSISLKYWLTCTCVSTPPPSLNAGTVYEGAFFSPPHRASPAWKNRVFLSTFFLYSWQEGSLWKKKKELNQWPQWYFFAPAAAVPGCVYRFIDYHHKAVICRDFAGTWLKIRKQRMVAQVGAGVSCWWTRTDTHTHVHRL